MSKLAITGNSPTPAASGSQRAAEVTFYRDPKNGETLRVREGNDLKIALSSGSKPGFGWRVVSVPKVLGEPKKTAAVMQETANGGCEFLWKTRNPIESLVGAHPVKLAYFDPADPSGAPQKVLNLTIEVLPAVRQAFDRLDASAMIAMIEKSKSINHGWHTAEGPPPPNYSPSDLKELPFVVWSDNGRPGGNYQDFLRANPQWPDFVNTAMGTLG